MATTNVIPYNSQHHSSVKTGIVKNLVRRAFTVCSTEEGLATELCNLKNILKRGNYPQYMLNDAISKEKSKVISGSTNNNKKEGEGTSENDLTRWGITYHPGIFEELARKLRSFGIQTVASQYKNLKTTLTSVKDPIPITQRKGVVYGLHCAQCEATYKGQTGQKLETRLYRHKLAERNGDGEHYPLVQHCKEKNHNIDWNQVDVLTTVTQQTKRCLVESMFIDRDQNTTNFHPGLKHSDGC